MREILFRGKTDKGEWVKGVPFFEEERCYIIQDLFICDEYACTGAVNSMVLPETVGQYTGLTDKNGKKIWEGDIVRTLAPCCIDKYIAGAVMFGDYSSTYQSSNVGYYVDWSLNKNIAMYCKMGDIEVIGNVFDNPEMLEVK